MKEKFCYESANDELEKADALVFAALGLTVFAFIIKSSLGTAVFFTLIGISVVLFILWLVQLDLKGFFAADENAVTFGRIFRKRIEYSAIKSIELYKTIRTHRDSKRHRDQARLIEKITFKCEDGDHSFACVLVPSKEYRSPGEAYSLLQKDWSNSAFSLLKVYIEDRISKTRNI